MCGRVWVMLGRWGSWVMSTSDEGRAEAEQPAVPEPIAAEPAPAVPEPAVPEPAVPDPVAPEPPPAPDRIAQPVVTYVDGEPVVSYAPAGSDDPTPPYGFPLPPAVPKPRRSYRKVWLSLLAATLSVVLIAVGYTVVRF